MAGEELGASWAKREGGGGIRGPAAGPGQGWTWRERWAPGDEEFGAKREEGSKRPATEGDRSRAMGCTGTEGARQGRLGVPGWAPAASG